MHTKRLQQMVTMLRELPSPFETGAIGFDIGTWHCGTTACAVGHACLSPEFQEQGLFLNAWNHPVFEGEEHWEAVEKFFELSSVQAEYLFYAERYPNRFEATSSDVADRIEQFIATAGA